jgi:hypothetical protein
LTSSGEERRKETVKRKTMVTAAVGTRTAIAAVDTARWIVEAVRAMRVGRATAFDWADKSSRRVKEAGEKEVVVRTSVGGLTPAMKWG